MKKLPVSFLAISILGLAGCNPTPVVTQNSTLPIDQANLCEVQQWGHDDVSKQCKPGQKVVFVPQSFGNQQLPVIFAAVNCDLRFNVVLTNGAVTCIYGPITPRPAEPAASR